MIGRIIAHYKILEKLGEGGMGVVYKAEDTKLKRTVALKFLPHGLEAQESERARFLQEAQTAATLNHPNICTVHDISEYQGQQFIVMEFVDGKPLKQMVPVQKTQDALDYAVQIGEALQEAHGHGVFHRDVKTANIMVNAKNRIKVMDFGLAKLKGSLKLTRTTSTMGTLPYMAPEQLTCGQADARSDIFSFGVVFYEMLAGQLPFPGDYEAAVIYSILNEAPVPVAKFRAELSSELLHIIDRALEKDPEDRYQAMQEMVIDLKRAKKESARVSWAPIAQPAGEQRQEAVSGQFGATAPAREKRGSRTLRIAEIIGAAVAAAAIALLTVRPSRAPQWNPAMTFRVLPMPSPEIGTPGLSRDGNWAAFPAEDADSKYNIYYANTASGKSRRITSDDSKYIIGADISPDGSWIVYDRLDAARSRWEIAVVSPVGDASRKVIDEGVFPRWRADGQRIGYVRGKGRGSQSGKAEFWTVRPNGSENRREKVDQASDKTMAFAWSPDGRSICWIRYLTEDRSEIFIHELSSGKERQLTFDKKNIAGVCWAANGQIIFSSNRSGNYNLWMVPASGGPPAQITRGAGPDYAATISHDGSKLLSYQMQQLGNIWIAGTDGSHPRQITFGDSYFWRVAFSPDGQQIVSGYLQPPAHEKGLFVCSMDRDGGNRKELTSGEENINNPVPSPDGRWIAYGRHPHDSSTESSMVHLIDAQNPGAPRPVGKGVPLRWIDEKSFISFDIASQTTWINRIDGEKPQKFFLDSTLAFPLQEGRYIAYYDFRSGHEGRWITAAPGVKAPDLPSARELLSPYYGEFDKSGKFFYYVRNAGELRRVSIPSGKEEVIPAAFPGLNPDFYHSSFDISYDGKEIVYTDTRYNCKLVMIENPFR